MNLEYFWFEGSEKDWDDIYNNYSILVKKENIQLEIELETKLNLVKNIRDLKTLELGDNWYDFLLEKYFKWKYTAPNRYITTTNTFRKAYNNNRELLDKKITSILEEKDKLDSEVMGFKAKRIHGLGYAGASGLLALLYPKLYGTIDQFIVKNLKAIRELPEITILERMKPENLNLDDFIIITEIYRNKSEELNRRFNSKIWTPRKIDSVLWSIR